ncbi:hypothetical protein GCM10022248_92840 [Nonomuraea soli]
MRVAQLLIFLQAAFSLLTIGQLVAGIGAAAPLIVLLLVAAHVPWIVAGWLAGRWRAPRPWHLGAALAMQVVGGGVGETMGLLEGEELSGLTDGTFAMTSAVVILLVMPASFAWFRKPVDAAPEMSTAAPTP